LGQAINGLGGYDLGPLFSGQGNAQGIPLGTAQWLPPDLAAQRYRYTGLPESSQFWFGESLEGSRTGLDYQDDRHVCLVSGSRGGKGAGIMGSPHDMFKTAR
jgi:hypothetical protein